MKLSTKNSFAASMLLVSTLALAACSPSNQNDSSAANTENTVTSPTSTASSATNSATNSATGSATADSDADSILSVSDAVVRATVEGNPMTSVFGTILNNSEEDVVITGFTASVEAQSYEIHEVVDGVMREKEGGFVIGAGESHELAPGGDHFMLMGLSAPVAAGDTVEIALELDNGTEVALAPIPVRTIAAGDESYGDDGELTGHEGTEHPAS